MFYYVHRDGVVVLLSLDIHGVDPAQSATGKVQRIPEILQIFGLLARRRGFMASTFPHTEESSGTLALSLIQDPGLDSVWIIWESTT